MSSSGEWAYTTTGSASHFFIEGRDRPLCNKPVIVYKRTGHKGNSHGDGCRQCYGILRQRLTMELLAAQRGK